MYCLDQYNEPLPEFCRRISETAGTPESTSVRKHHANPVNCPAAGRSLTLPSLPSDRTGNPSVNLVCLTPSVLPQDWGISITHSIAACETRHPDLESGHG